MAADATETLGESSIGGEEFVEAIRPLSRKPLFYIVNTDEGKDYTGGNENVGKVGRPVDRGATGAYIIAFVTVLDRMSAPTGQAPRLRKQGGRATPIRYPRRTLL